MEQYLTHLSLKKIAYLILVLGTALIVYFQLGAVQASWMFFSAFIFSLIAPNTAQLSSLIKFFLQTLLLILILLIVGNTFVPSYLQILMILAVIMILARLPARYSKNELIIILVSVFAILASMFPLHFAANLTRCGMMLIGFFIAITWQLIIFYHQNNLRDAEVMLVTALNHLSACIMSCFLEPEYSENRYSFEYRLYKQKTNCLQSFLQLEQQIKVSASQIEQTRFIQFNLIFDVLVSCAQLRFRITDFSVLDVCKIELTEIDLALTRVWRAMLAKPEELKIGITELKWKIERLDDNFQHVLQVSAPEPLVLLLLIVNLRYLCNEMMVMVDENEIYLNK